MDVFRDNPKNCQDVKGGTKFDQDSGLWRRYKVLGGHTAMYLDPKRKTALTSYKDPVIHYLNIALDRAMEQLSHILPKTKDHFPHLTNFAEVKVVGTPFSNEILIVQEVYGELRKI